MVGNRLVVDANIFLEALLLQKRGQECSLFLSKVADSGYKIFITAFSLFAVALRLERAGNLEVFVRFVAECENFGFEIIQPAFKDQSAVVDICKKYRLDFDDAQQYLAAKESEAVLVSFDKDFDETDLKRVEPKDVLDTIV